MLSLFLHRIRNFNKRLFDYEQGSNPLTTHLRFISKTQQENPIKNQSNSSVTISYLTNSCGLSPQLALSAAKKIQLKTTENADSVLNLLKSHGFTNTQITKLITKNPWLLLSSVEKTLKPKIEFFLGVGFSSTEFASLLFSEPCLLGSSLQNRLKPNFELISSMVGNNKKLRVALRSARFLGTNLEANFLPNVRILQSYGVPSPNIAKLATLCLRGLTGKTKKFATTVESIKKIGFSPLSPLFVKGVMAKSAISRLTWERKLGVYKSMGFSEGEIVSAFTKQPECMLLSEKKIRQMVDFYVKRMHLEPNYLAARPVLLCLSLEKRVLPRCSVLRILSSNRLIKGFPCVYFGAFLLNEDMFYNRYVSKYMDQVPDVLEANKGNLEFVEFEGGPSTGQGS